MKVGINALKIATISSCMLCATLAMAASKPVISNKNLQKPVTLLFVIKAKHAKLQRVKGNDFRLTIQKSSIINGILAFSDRPNRVTFRMSLGEYLRLNHKGADSFLMDPPNVSLSWADKSPAMPYTMSGGTTSKSYVHWHLRALDKGSEASVRSGQLTVLIDSDSGGDTYTLKCTTSAALGGSSTSSGGLTSQQCSDEKNRIENIMKGGNRTNCSCTQS